ncbi:hypothetical protein O3P69_011484 [Scylla paramamosain]|uniref:Uncharacterized protein n=1 Tax=Scylla paramamosain TaxID=85552 RepID=A0AAW0T5P2_SCYPA
MSKISTLEELKLQAMTLGLSEDDTECAEAKPSLLHHGSSVQGPELPTYQESEDVASYLTLLEVGESSLAVQMGSLLTRKAAELYSTLNTNTIGDFILLKQALLRGFNKTLERYQQDFRCNKINIGENYWQFSIRLLQLFDSWLEASKTPNTFEGLQHQVTMFKTAAKKADNFASAHNTYLKHNINSASGKSSFSTKRATSTESDPKNTSSRIKCYNCREGHLRGSVPQESWSLQGQSRPIINAQVASTINSSWSSTIIWVTGCNCVIISKEAVPNTDISSCPKIPVEDFLGRVNEFLVVPSLISCPYYEGWTNTVWHFDLCCGVPTPQFQRMPVEPHSLKLTWSRLAP